jgi:hypothetical protein
MKPEYEEALYEFLENVTEPFSLGNVIVFLKMMVRGRAPHLTREIRDILNSGSIAFKNGEDRWISRRGFFEPVPFVISPSRLELLNGILVPGHRCLPFANPDVMPHNFTFFWNNEPIPWETTEGPPGDFYPYYLLFGEEYVSQYVAKDNPENEIAYNSDAFEDPIEVSIHTLDMRQIYRETAFIPGDRFVVKTRDWKKSSFDFSLVKKDAWAEKDLDAWRSAAEAGFAVSFERMGACSCTEEQIVFAYWLGSRRMCEVPAYSLEEFIYEKTVSIETTTYGIETRYWFAGKDIPDLEYLQSYFPAAERSMIEEILFNFGVPVSEYVIQSYVRDALFCKDYKELDVVRIASRIAPPSTGIPGNDLETIAAYILRALMEFQRVYSRFSDQFMGPIRQRAAELHTAVIDLACRLRKGDFDPSWLPKHTFLILSQVQSHAAMLLEDLDEEDAPSEEELEAMDNSLDSMIEAYEDIKRLLDDSLNNFRRNKLSLVKSDGHGTSSFWKILQLSLGGTNVWRRIGMPGASRLEELHRVIQALFSWDNRWPYRFSTQSPVWKEEITLEELDAGGFAEVLYEYGSIWTVKIIVISSYEAEEGERIHCIAGEYASPPSFVEGPLRFKKFLADLTRGNKQKWRLVRSGEYEDFNPEAFSLEECNNRLEGILLYERTGTETEL